MNKIYTAYYITGDVSDWQHIPVFASENKEMVDAWVEKFNSKLKVWKEYFKQFSHESCATCIADEFRHKTNRRRFYNIMECQNAYCGEIEKR